jgi:hypothetical protein
MTHGRLATLAFLLLATFAAGPATTRSTSERTLRGVIVSKREGGTLLMAGTRMRVDNDGTVMIADAAAADAGTLQLDTKGKLAYRLPARGPSPAIDFYTLFRALADDRGDPVEDHVDANGRRFPGHRARGASTLSTGQPWRVEASVWTDPATKLPVRVEMRPPGGRGEAMLIERIEFDGPIDESPFEMKVPEGYNVVGDVSLKAPPTPDEAAKLLTITPREGIGPVRFGATRAEIVAAFGEPEHEQFDVYLNYPSRGLQLVLAGAEAGRLGLIIANPADAANANRHAFAGATREGVRIGSTAAEIVAAYGPADAPPAGEPPRAEQLLYGRLGTQFVLMNGRVAQMIVGRVYEPATSQPSTTSQPATRPAVSFRARVTSTLGGDDGTAVLSAKGDWLRFDHAPNGRVRVERYDSREAIDTDPARRLATVREFMSEPPTLLTLVREPPTGAAIGERTIDGRPTSGLERPGDGPLRGGTVRVWSDAETGRPVRIEVFAPKKPDEPAVSIDQFEFDVPLDDALFSLAPPEGYTVEQGLGLRAERLRPAATTQEAAALILTPRVGIGPVTFGMTYDQVAAALGPPDQRRGGQLNYFSRGLTLLVGGDDSLHFIAARAAASVPYSASRDFPGQTDKGIRIGSSRANVIAAYGEPTEISRRDREELIYLPAWIRFEIEGDRVTGIMLSRPDAGR